MAWVEGSMLSIGYHYWEISLALYTVQKVLESGIGSYNFSENV